MIGYRKHLAWILGCVLLCLIAWHPTIAEENSLPNARPVPDVQVVPLPYDQASFEHQGRELTRFHFSETLERTFLYPIVGPAGRSLTRMGHPRDPMGHSHHNSIWISHMDVEGVNFWEDRTPKKIVCRRIEQYEDSPTRAWLLALHEWQGPDGKTLLVERRRIEVEPFDEGQWRMILDIQLETPRDQSVELGQTPFGPIGVRMAKTLGVRDGGGRILNSEGQVNERACFRKPARWVDYSGSINATQNEGITLMDHPINPNHPAPFHVRDDGWMGACLTLNGPVVIEPKKPLRLRYGLWIHRDVPNREQIDPHWQAFSQLDLPPMTRQR